MGAEYGEFLLLENILQAIFIAQAENEYMQLPQKVLHYLLLVRFPEVTEALKITRSDYVSLQRKFAANSDDTYKYVYSLCPSYQYAFVEEGKSIFFPLPHLFSQCVTSSLLYRLTEGDNALRDDIGKHIWEKYLVRLIEDTGIYQEVFPEQRYTYSGSVSHSPDVLARQDDSVLLIDSKSTVPNLGIRLFDAASYERNIRIVAQNIVKLYNQMYRFDRYNPFGENVAADKEKLWGIVVVLEDAYIRRMRYFEEAGKELKIQEGSDEWTWMITHIKVISLYEIERLCLQGYSVIVACRESFKEDPFNFTFMGHPPKGSKFTNKDYLEFRASYNQKIEDLIVDMKEQGLLQ